MSNRIYHLSSCNTCQRIIKEIAEKTDISQFELIDIKQNNIPESDVDFIAEQEGSYEKVFSKRAMKYRSMGLNEMSLSEADFKKHILEEYTFLKRPVVFFENKAYVGNTKKVVASLIENL